MAGKYDVIIIGAGIGGLTAGAILARNGKKVLVLEKNPMVGGYAVNFKRKGFEFDASLHLINSCSRNDRTHNILKQCGVANKIKFLKPKDLYVSIFPDRELKVPQCDFKKYLRLLQKSFPNHKDRILKLYSEINNIYKSIYRFDRYGELSPEFIKSTATTCDNFFHNYFNDGQLEAAIFQLWAYFGLPPSKLPVFYFAYPWHNYLCKGGFYPMGGSKEISNALADIIRSNGGEILFNKSVEKIVIKDNIAKSVVIDNGNEYQGEVTISNIDARRTFLNLIPADYLPVQFIDTIKSMKPSLSVFQVYLGLSVNLKKLGINSYEFFLNPDYDIENHYISALENNVEKNALGVTIYSNLCEKFAPPGKSVVVITMFSNYKYWSGLNQQAYKEEKSRFAETMIKCVEKIIPNLPDYIEFCETASPLTMERYTFNYEGAIYGWEQSVPQTGIMRMDRITPIKNLFMAGAWTRPGGGIAGVIYSGKAIASELLKNKERW